MGGERRSGAHEGDRTVQPGGVPGIVIAVGRQTGRASPRRPQIEAFVWGARVRPSPTLPYGRWKAGD